MIAYVCFDDTDILGAERGTGKLSRMFEDVLPEGCVLHSILRQQFPIHEDIPYTSHNSSACVVVECPDESYRQPLIDAAIAHVEKWAYDGSDPGVCVALETDPSLEGKLYDFARKAQVEVVSQDEAREAASEIHLSGHGGTNQGIIGAAAGAALTHWGWTGRYLEYGASRLGRFESPADVADIEAAGLILVTIDRNVVAPKPGDTIEFEGRLRPLMIGGRPCLPLQKLEEGRWLSMSRKIALKEGVAQ